MTPEHIITHAIRYDHKPGANARDIITALEDAGFRITPAGLRTMDLPEITRTYAPAPAPSPLAVTHPLYRVPTFTGRATVTTTSAGRTWVDATVEP